MDVNLFWGIAALVLLYLALLFWLHGGLARQGGHPAEGSTPSVSVIVAARNEEQRLPVLLDALQQQSYASERFEMIVADDGSTDATPQILADYARKVKHLTNLRIDSVPAGWSPKKWALTQAIDRSSGEIILTTDADCLPGPMWISSMVRPFADPGVGFASGPAPLEVVRSEPPYGDGEERYGTVPAPTNSRWREMLLLDSCALDALAAGALGRGLVLTAVGRNLAYRRAAFDEAEGFEGIQQFISGDDDLLVHKLAATGEWKGAFVISPAAAVPSPPPETFPAFVAQRLRFASKGRHYFRLPVSRRFKAILALLFLANLAALLSMAAFVVTGILIWLIPIALKIGAEGLLVRPYLRRIGRPIRLTTLIMTGALYPFYVTLLGSLGSFTRIAWRGRSAAGQVDATP